MITRPKPMSKVTIFGPKSYMKEVIEELYNLDVVHIEDYTKKTDDFFDIGTPYDSNEKNSEILVKIRSLISTLNIKKAETRQSKLSIDLIDKKTDQIYEKASSLLEKKEFYSRLMKIYTKKLQEKSLSSLKIELDNEKSDDYIHFIGFVDAEADLLKKELEKISKDIILFTTNFEGLTLAAVFTESKKKDKVADLLNSFEFSAIDSPLIKKQYPSLKSKSASKFIKLDYEAEITAKKSKKNLFELSEIVAEHHNFLIEAEERLFMETDKAEAPLKFATTKNTFTIKGWIPNENTKKLHETLDKLTSKRVMIRFEKPAKKDNVPIAFNHPKIVEPFEAFMELYTLPSYKEIDPTFFMFLTFPIFFGFMLGDVGYGLVTLALFLFLRKKMPGAKNLLNAFIIASISSIIFGFVFGEYFGFEEVSPALGQALGIHPEEHILHGEPELVYSLPRLFARSTNIKDLLSIAILFGIVHLLIGFIIGFINIYKAHGLKHAIIEKGGWMLIMPLMVWLLLNFLNIITGFTADMIQTIMPPFPVIVGMFIIGAILVVIGEGINGAIEVLFLSLLSNILSYARLMAVGLASLSLAVVVNNLAGQMFSGGIGGIIAGILVLVLGHSINIALGILSPFLHSLRLHYVEFFGKFFKGGGRAFKSFGNSKP